MRFGHPALMSVGRELPGKVYISPDGVEYSPFWRIFTVNGPGGGDFQTLTAARDFSQAGDLIIVYPSLTPYIANDLAKDGVHWHFMPGAKVTYNYVNGETPTRAIFDDRGTAMNFSVDGHGEFYTTGQISTLGEYGGSCLGISHANSTVHFRCASIDTDVDSSASLFGVWVKNCNRVWVDCDRIAVGRFSAGIGPLEPSCVGWENGEMYVRAKEIVVKTPPVEILGWCIYANEPVAGANVNAYIEADLIENQSNNAIYMNANSPNYKLWVRAKEIRASNAAAIGLAAVELKGGGKLYIDCEKLNADNVYAAAAGPLPALKQTAGEMWVTAQKITSNTGINHTNPMFLNQSGGTSWIRVLQYEQAGNFSTGEAFKVSGGEANIIGGTVKCLNGKGLVHSGGVSRLTGVHIDTSPTNAAANRPVEVSSAGVTLRDCWLVTPAAANSIFAGSAQNVKVKNCAATIAKHANVTLQVDPANGLLVDANVT